MKKLLLLSLGILNLCQMRCFADGPASGAHKLLYVAEPGIRDYLEYGGHGLLVFDIDHAHRFVRRIPTAGVDENGKPLNVKGVCASITTKRIYVSTTRSILCLDLVTDKLLWEKKYEGGCDRMALAPDGQTIYVPSLEGDHWHVIGAINGDVIEKIVRKSGAHNTIFGLDGSHVFLAGLKSPVLTVMDARTRQVSATIGPFGNVIRPFTVNGAQTLCFVNVNGLLGFEIGNLRTGKVLHRVEIPGAKPGSEKRHGCPSHGIGLTPDESELWLTDAANSHMHVFDATVMPPKEIAQVRLRDQPGWITFGLDGRFAYPSTGDVVDVKSRKIVAQLTDETGRGVQSEKLLEIDFNGNQPVQVGDQFGLGRRLP
jgi:DNA-binding beta-propeller fold protein YncE